MLSVWRSRTGRAAVILVIIVITVAVGLALRGGEEKVAPGADSEPETSKEVPEMQFSGTKIVGRKEGQKVFELSIDTFGLADAGASNVSFEGLSSGTFYQDGEPWVDIKAARGWWDKSTNDLELKGDVVVFSEGEPMLLTQSLAYNARKEVLTSPEAVKVRIGGMEISAETMEAHLKENTIHLRGHVQAEHEGGTRISAGEMVYLTDQRRIQIFGPADIELVLRNEGRGEKTSEQAGKER